MEGVKKEPFYSDGLKLISYRIGNPEGEPVVLVSGLGGPFSSWKYLLQRGKESFHFFSWDYRGLFSSERPSRTEELAVPFHGKDLRNLLDHFQIGKAHLVAWSMGVQVALEFYRMGEERVRSLVLLNGVAGKPFEQYGSVGFLLIRNIVQFLKDHPDSTRRVVHTLPSLIPLLDPLLKGKIVPFHLDSHFLQEVVEEFSKVDFSTYYQILLLLNHHTAEDVLPSIKVPTLVVAGEWDPFTPFPAMKRMAEKIPSARFHTIPRATHYALVEQPEKVSRLICDFLKGV